MDANHGRWDEGCSFTKIYVKICSLSVIERVFKLNFKCNTLFVFLNYLKVNKLYTEMIIIFVDYFVCF